MNDLLRIDNIEKYYGTKSSLTKALDGLSFSVAKKEFVAIMGASGSGKTTLLSLMSALDVPTSGKILYNGIDISSIDESKYRSNNVGVVFQSFNLLPHLSAIENVILSMDISNIQINDKAKKNEALALLEDVGLNEQKANRRVLKLSGGEQQRVAIARFIV